MPALDSLFLRTAPPHAPPNSSLNRGDVVEVQGPASSGKTWLIDQMVMSCVLPYELLEEPSSLMSPTIGGWNKSAIVFDTQGRWNVNRLAKMLRSRLRKGGLSPETADVIVGDSLRRVHIFRPKSSSSLAATIFRLPHYHATQMPNEEIGLLAIDSISTFYWEDKYESEQQRAYGLGFHDSINNLSKVLFALQEFRLSHGPVIAFTNWALVPNNPNVQKSIHDGEQQSTGPAYKQHLLPFPAPFEDPPRQPANANLMPPVTHQITLSPASRQPGSALPLESQGVRERRRTVGGVLRAGGAVESTFKVALEEEL